MSLEVLAGAVGDVADGPEKMGGSMKCPHGRDRRVELLRELMERLDAPDLTLAEAKDLRDRLGALLEPEDATDPGAQPRPTPSVGGEEWEAAHRPTVFSRCGVG